MERCSMEWSVAELGRLMLNLFDGVKVHDMNRFWSFSLPEYIKAKRKLRHKHNLLTRLILGFHYLTLHYRNRDLFGLQLDIEPMETLN